MGGFEGGEGMGGRGTHVGKWGQKGGVGGGCRRVPGVGEKDVRYKVVFVGIVGRNDSDADDEDGDGDDEGNDNGVYTVAVV